MTTGEEWPSAPAQQVTIRHQTPLHPGWVRNIQLSDQFVFVKKHGSPVVGLHVDDLIAAAVAVEPKLSFPPLFTEFPISITVKAGDSSTMSVKVSSELPDLKYQWQFSTALDSTWVNVDGATSDSEVFKDAGFYRCVATNGAGETTTEPAQLIISKD